MIRFKKISLLIAIASLLLTTDVFAARSRPTVDKEAMANRITQRKANAVERQKRVLGSQRRIVRVTPAQRTRNAIANRKVSRVAPVQKTPEVIANQRTSRVAPVQKTPEAVANRRPSRVAPVQKTPEVIANQRTSRVAPVQKTPEVVANRRPSRVAPVQKTPEVVANRRVSRKTPTQAQTHSYMVREVNGQWSAAYVTDKGIVVRTPKGIVAKTSNGDFVGKRVQFGNSNLSRDLPQQEFIQEVQKFGNIRKVMPLSNELLEALYKKYNA